MRLLKTDLCTSSFPCCQRNKPDAVLLVVVEGGTLTHLWASVYSPTVDFAMGTSWDEVLHLFDLEKLYT